MEKLTKYNVEAWVLDYHEGCLSEEQIVLLKDFLASNPGLNIDLNFSDFTVLTPPKLVYNGKADLYRTDFSIPEMSEEELEIVARLEGDLFPHEEKAFDESLKEDTEKAVIFEHFKRTILRPNFEEVYKEKEALLKKVFFIPSYAYGAIATAAIVILAWFIFSPNQDSTDPVQLAADSVRSEVIYLDKLVHPAEFDKIASVEPNRQIKASSNSEIITEEIEERQINQMNPIDKIAIAQISSSFQATSSYDAFVYRPLPFESTQEYQTFLAFSGDMIRKNILGEDPARVKKSRFSLWELADAGLEKVAQIFSVPMDIEREYNQEGDLVEVSFDSRLLAFSTPVNTRKAQ